MGFSTNYDDIQDYGLIPEGSYEVVITKVSEHTTKKGVKGLSFTLVVRNDVQQECKNRLIFHTLWKRKEPTEADLQVQGYSFRQIMQVAKSAKLPNGKSYESLDALCDELIGRVMCVEVEHEEYNGRMQAKVTEISQSAYPECNHKYKNAVSADTVAQPKNESFASSTGDMSDFEEILSDEDVPF